MTAQQLKERLSEEDIKKLLLEMGATFYYEDDDMWITDTICHHGNKPKLYYYKDSKSFHCYTECGQLDIIGIVMGYKDFTQEEFQKAINWICIKLNLDNCEYGFGKQEQISDWEFIRSYKKSSKKINKEKELVPYDPSILKIFQPFYPKCWIDEGISIRSMEQRYVASVVLNRVTDSRFPNSLEGVIFQKRQYACISDGNFYRTPTERNWMNAKWILENGSILPQKVVWQSGGRQGRLYLRTKWHSYCY